MAWDTNANVIGDLNNKNDLDSTFTAKWFVKILEK